jgi:PAS domain S-box-containing protein
VPGPLQISPTVLYVDDTEAQRYAVSRVLRRAGFEVMQASSGRQALEMSASGPDIVLLDVNLPDINGIEVCKRIKADKATSHIPVLQVSATLVDTRHRVAGLEGGADAYLVQPIDPDELVATIRSLLRIRKAEEEARRRAQEIETIYNSAPVGLAMLDADLRFTRVNQLLAQFNGLPVHEHIGRPMQELVPEVAAKVNHFFRQVLSTGEPLVNLEIKTPAPAQPDLIRDWLVNLHPLKNERGQVVGVNAVVQEITDRKRAEEEIKKSQELFQAFMDNLPVFAYMKDENGRYVFHNRAVGLRFPQLCRTVGKDDSELFSPEVAESFRRNDQMVRETGKPAEFTETSGDIEWLSIKFPFTDRQGKVLLAGVSVDVSERKQLEKLTIMQETQRQLLEHEILARESERERLARELHDESGQMLTSLLAGLRLIEESKTVKDAKKQARALRELTSRAIGDVGRLSRDLHPIVLDDLGFAVALRNYVNQYSTLHGINAQLEIVGLDGDRLPHSMERGLYRITQEALTNVARHAQATEVAVAACLEGQHFTMTIRDDGRGFSTLNKNSDGSKHLGLQSMRERASIMGAQLKVESAPGEGTCITVSVKIPVSAESPAREIASKDSRKPAC